MTSAEMPLGLILPTTRYQRDDSDRNIRDIQISPRTCYSGTEYGCPASHHLHTWRYPDIRVTDMSEIQIQASSKQDGKLHSVDRKGRITDAGSRYSVREDRKIVNRLCAVQ